MKKKGNNLKKWWPYYLLFLPAAIYLIMFNYIPMSGLVLAFKEYWPKYGMFQSPWAEPFYKNFAYLFQDSYFWQVLKNTVVISVLRFVVTFPATILVALLFNELRSKRYAKFVQTIMFIPYFVSWVVIAGIARKVFSIDGLVNGFLDMLGIDKVRFMTTEIPFLVLLILIDLWKGWGYGMILYLASMSSIDSGLYEAVEIDGGNRWTKMWHVTLPGLKSIIVMQIVLSMAGILNGGFEQIWNMYSVPVYNVADILDTYLFRISFGQEQDHALSTALGLFKSVIGLILVLGTDKLSKKISGEGAL